MNFLSSNFLFLKTIIKKLLTELYISNTSKTYKPYSYEN